MSAYCSYPECHDSRVNWYGWSGTGNSAGMTLRATWYSGGGSGEPLCRIHALEKYRFAGWHPETTPGGLA